MNTGFKPISGVLHQVQLYSRLRVSVFATSSPTPRPYFSTTHATITKSSQQHVLAMDDGSEPAIPLLPRASSSTMSTSPYKTSQRRPENEDIVDDLEDTATLIIEHPHSPSPPSSAVPRIRRHQRRQPHGLREILYSLLERPNSSQAAFTIHLMVNALILLSALLTVMETLPFFHHVSSAVWFGLETTIVVCFTFEYFARVIAWSESYAIFWGWFSCGWPIFFFRDAEESRTDDVVKPSLGWWIFWPSYRIISRSRCTPILCVPAMAQRSRFIYIECRQHSFDSPYYGPFDYFVSSDLSSTPPP